MKKRFLIIFFALIISMFVACNMTEKESGVENNITNIPTGVSNSTCVLVTTNTPVPTSTIILTSTPIPTSLPTPTSTPTPVPLFTYIEYGKGIKITDFLDETITDLEIPIEYDGYIICGIAAGAFKDNKNLISIIISENIVEVEPAAFEGCSNLEQIVVSIENPRYTSRTEDGIESNVVIDKWEHNVLVCGCNNSVIPDSVESIGSFAFAGSKIEKIIFPKSVEKVDEYAFANCSELKELVVEEKIALEKNAFMNCNNVEKLTVSVDSYEVFLKEFRNRVKSLNLLEGFTKITESTFENCYELKELYIPASVVLISNNAFCYCDSLEKIVVAEENEFYTSRDFNGQECNAIIDKEFKSVILGCGNTFFPEDITSIGSNAFCGGVFEGTFPVSLKKIESNAFYGGITLKEIIITEDTIIEKEAFSNCIVDRVTVPMSMTDFFRDCGVKELVLTGEETEIYESQFCNNDDIWGSLMRVTIPESVNDIKMLAFGGCHSLEQVEIPEGVVYVGDCAFMGCSSLEKLEFSQNVTSIGEMAFCDCSSLKEVVIPNSVNFVGEYAFSGCNAMKKISLSYSMTGIDAWSFCANESLVEVIIPNSVLSIERCAFSDCSSLTEIEIPDSVTRIADSAFDDCTNLVYIIASEDSYAALWAKEHGYRVKSVME